MSYLLICVFVIFFVPRSSVLRKAFELQSFEFHGTKIIITVLVDAWFYYWSLTPYSFSVEGKGNCSLLF